VAVEQRQPNVREYGQMARTGQPPPSRISIAHAREPWERAAFPCSTPHGSMFANDHERLGRQMIGLIVVFSMMRGPKHSR
jgi:hypothetical protein